MENSKLRCMARRDSATTMLRKLGVPKDRYDDFIVKGDNGEYFVDVAEAKASLEQKEVVEEPKEEIMAEVKAEIKSEVKKVVKAEVKKIVKKQVTNKPQSKIDIKGEKRTVSSVCRSLISMGKTNAEVWELVKAEFKLDDSKKHYPSWYRSEMTRSGKLK